VARDGEVLIANTIFRADLVYAGDGSGPQTLLSWFDLNHPVAALSAEGRVLFSTGQAVANKADAWVVLRSADGAPAQILGEGYAMDLSADGRWALVLSLDYTRLTAVPTGVGKVRSISTGGLVQIRAARWMPDAKEVLVVGRSAGESHFRLHRLTADASSPGRSEKPRCARPAPSLARWAVGRGTGRRQAAGDRLGPRRINAPSAARGRGSGGAAWLGAGREPLGQRG
jgi:hypothetical protein